LDTAGRGGCCHGVVTRRHEARAAWSSRTSDARIGFGAGAGGLLDHHRKSEIKHDVEDSLPPNSSGIVALFEQKWTADMDKLRARAEKITKHEVDAQSVENVKASASAPARVRTPVRSAGASTETASAATESAGSGTSDT
jgi:hypothetical protein